MRKLYNAKLEMLVSYITACIPRVQADDISIENL